MPSFWEPIMQYKVIYYKIKPHPRYLQGNYHSNVSLKVSLHKRNLTEIPLFSRKNVLICPIKQLPEWIRINLLKSPETIDFTRKKPSKHYTWKAFI